MKDFGRGNVMVGGSAVRRNMADRVGTFEGVLQELEASNTTSPESVASPSAALDKPEEETMADPNGKAEETSSAPATNAADSADVVDYCHSAGVPQLAAGLIREQASMETVKARVADVGTMQDMVQQAVSQNMVEQATADKLFDNAIKLNKSADGLSRDLLQASFQTQSADDSIVTRTNPETGVSSDNSQSYMDKALANLVGSASK